VGLVIVGHQNHLECHEKWVGPYKKLEKFPGAGSPENASKVGLARAKIPLKFRRGILIDWAERAK
jgi:hypothetical protein